MNEFVYQLKRDLPHLELIINGGITDLQQAQAHLQVQRYSKYLLY